MMEFSYYCQKRRQKSKLQIIQCGGCQKQFCKGDLSVSFPYTRQVPLSKSTFHLDCYKNTFDTIPMAELQIELDESTFLPHDKQKIIDFWTRCDKLYQDAQIKKRKHDLLFDTDPEVKKAPKSSKFGSFPTDIWEIILSFTNDMKIAPEGSLY
jgi:hypothetical protein